MYRDVGNDETIDGFFFDYLAVIVVIDRAHS